MSTTQKPVEAGSEAGFVSEAAAGVVEAAGLGAEVSEAGWGRRGGRKMYSTESGRCHRGRCFGGRAMPLL